MQLSIFNGCLKMCAGKYIIWLKSLNSAIQVAILNLQWEDATKFTKWVTECSFYLVALFISHFLALIFSFSFKKY
jgi:hypothetical protein